MELMAKTTKSTDSNSSIPTASQQLFVSTAITLTWQLLVVVLLPFLGGHFLDKKLGSQPLWTLIGLAVSLSMAALVTYRAYKTLNEDYLKQSNKHD
jgi:F0F1-type ATP synthase assembly protein I